MTPAQELSQLAEVVQAKYEQHQKRFAALVAQENELRSELARLDDMQRNTNAPEGSLAQMRALGADVIWQAWLGRSKTALNLQLAQVLAQKEGLQTAVRQAYGKVLVVNQMRDDAQQDAARLMMKNQLTQAISQSLRYSCD